MAHFAQIDENNTVINVLVVPDDQEHCGEQYLHSIGIQGKWVQTSFTNKIRKEFATIGGSYDSANDVFIRPKPFPSWILDANFDWQAPTPKPSEGNWFWDETSTSWLESLPFEEITGLPT